MRGKIKCTYKKQSLILAYLGPFLISKMTGFEFEWWFSSFDKKLGWMLAFNERCLIWVGCGMYSISGYLILPSIIERSRDADEPDGDGYIQHDRQGVQKCLWCFLWQTRIGNWVHGWPFLQVSTCHTQRWSQGKLKLELAPDTFPQCSSIIPKHTGSISDKRLPLGVPNACSMYIACALVQLWSWKTFN